ncbi:MAG TPA: PHP domain-containing protein, partial [Candidatus Bathyarchaeia archaeon]
MIDLHIHSKASDGKLSIREICKEAKDRNIDFMAITDHDSIGCQDQATSLAKKARIRYITGVELNVTFSHPEFHEGKAVSLDFLGYQFDPQNKALEYKMETMAHYREERAAKILDNLNGEFQKEGISALTKEDLGQIEESVDGVLGRPHIADY